MLTPAQQRIKQELEKLKAKGRLPRNEEHIASLTKNTRNRWIYTAFVIFFVIVAFSFLLIGIYHS